MCVCVCVCHVSSCCTHITLFNRAESTKDNINMSHNTTGLTVSRKVSSSSSYTMEPWEGGDVTEFCRWLIKTDAMMWDSIESQEAERLEQENASRLVEDRKLSLILDLDQTVVHATWDPTVGEWMKDENNANHPATKDIRKFTLPGSNLMYYIKLRQVSKCVHLERIMSSCMVI